jgi:hypothetical protein
LRPFGFAQGFGVALLCLRLTPPARRLRPRSFASLRISAAGSRSLRSLTPAKRLKLLRYSDPGNLAAFPAFRDTRFTYHRTWETGLGAEIRITVADPEFFAPKFPHSQ